MFLQIRMSALTASQLVSMADQEFDTAIQDMSTKVNDNLLPLKLFIERNPCRLLICILLAKQQNNFLY